MTAPRRLFISFSTFGLAAAEDVLRDAGGVEVPATAANGARRALCVACCAGCWGGHRAAVRRKLTGPHGCCGPPPDARAFARATIGRDSASCRHTPRGL